MDAPQFGFTAPRRCSRPASGGTGGGGEVGVLGVLDDPGAANWPFGATDDAEVAPSLVARAKGHPWSSSRPSRSRMAVCRSTGKTQVIAATIDLLPEAEEVRRLLGLGKVYVGPQPTRIADITIVMGKDYSRD
jgi:hypothetical protein